MPLITGLVKGIGSGIGLAAEAIADHKERKQAKERGVSPNTPGDSPGSEQSYSSSGDLYGPDTEKRGRQPREAEDNPESPYYLQDDKAEWALDEAAADLPPPSYDDSASSTPVSADEAARAFLNNHDVAPTPSQSYQPLPCPVILPQRRPKDKSRGFIRAYAPVLGECSGIDERTFIDFLNDLDRASRASPVFDVINMACVGVGFVPSPIAMGVSIAVQAANRTAQEVQSRYRRNTYLDQINETLFKPRGLYCMIMTFKPDNPHEPVMGMDVRSLSPSTSEQQALLKATAVPESGMSRQTKKIRLTSGVSQGEMSLPQAAPLVYPGLDAVLAKQEEEVSPSRLKGLKASAGFVSDYLDRRAQARYAGTNPDSRLAVAPPPEKKFASRFSDPNHPANSGTILGLVTGGKFDPKAKRRGQRAQELARAQGYELSETEIRNAEMGREPPRPKKGLVRRILHKDVLYLTVVNLPSEAEMKEMLQQLDSVKKANRR
ncbi:Burnettramic acids biosynthesis cluster protein E [Exophiala dermatitidis]